MEREFFAVYLMGLNGKILFKCGRLLIPFYTIWKQIKCIPGMIKGFLTLFAVGTSRGLCCT